MAEHAPIAGGATCQKTGAVHVERRLSIRCVERLGPAAGSDAGAVHCGSGPVPILDGASESAVHTGRTNHAAWKYGVTAWFHCWVSGLAWVVCYDF